MIDTSTPEGRAKRLDEIVMGYLRTRNWRALAQAFGISRYDFDYSDADAGEAPKGARW